MDGMKALVMFVQHTHEILECMLQAGHFLKLGLLNTSVQRMRIEIEHLHCTLSMYTFICFSDVEKYDLSQTFSLL